MFQFLVNGSYALKREFSSEFPRMPRDIDGYLRGTDDSIKGMYRGKRIELKGIPVDLYDKMFCYATGARWPSTTPTAEIFLPTEVLYTIKVSHSFFDVHWEKTMSDILWMQQHNVPERQDRYSRIKTPVMGRLREEIFQDLYAFWLQRHKNNKSKITFNKKNEDFFKNGVKYEYDHDYLHSLVKYYDTPMYTRIKHDQSLALTSKELFDNLCQEEKLNLCREEISVIALERFLIPTDFQTPLMGAWRGAAKKLITTMSKGWFPRFIVENWQHLHKPDTNHNFVKLFKEGVNYK